MRTTLLNVFLMLLVSSPATFSLSGHASAEQPENLYRDGLAHFEQERYVEAVRAFRNAADEGDASAIGFLGWMYLEGKELSAGRPLIIDWFDKTNAHTVLLCGYDRNTEEFFFRNTGLPYPGIQIRSESWLKKNWATRNYIPNNNVVRRAAIRIVNRKHRP